MAEFVLEGYFFVTKKSRSAEKILRIQWTRKRRSKIISRVRIAKAPKQSKYLTLKNQDTPFKPQKKS